MPSFVSPTNILTGALALTLPTSMLIWIIYYVFPFRDSEVDLSPFRCLVSILIPTLMLYNAAKNRKLDSTAMIVAFLMGFIETLSNMCMIFTTLTFFMVGTRATEYKRSQKKINDDDSSQRGGRRNWIQVLSNGGVGMEIAILMLIERGPANEMPIDFSRDYFSSCLALAFLGSISCACGDTLASELAPVLSSASPRLITNPFRKVPKGTNGGVTLVGFFLSAFGGFLCGLTYYVLIHLTVSHNRLAISSKQWPIIIFSVIAGLLGSLLDSILGATVQYSGKEKSSGKIVGKFKEGVEKISGTEILDNHSVNLVSTLLTAAISPLLAKQVWFYFGSYTLL